MRTYIKRIVLTLSIILVTISGMSQNIVDNQWGFKLNIPSSWLTKNYMDGSDKVYDFYSADQNAAASMRIFNINKQVTYDVLIPLYEKNMLSSANRLDLRDLTSKNGIPGKQAIYSMDYNGTKVDIAVFYTLQNSKAYIITAFVASAVAANYKADIQSITSSFTIDGVGSSAPVAKKVEKTSGLSGLMGVRSQNPNTSKNTTTGENYITISGNGRNDTYYFKTSSCHPHPWLSMTTIRGLDKNGHLVMEIFLNQERAGRYTYGRGKSNTNYFYFGNIGNAGVNDSGATGNLNITQYQVGGKIKGNFTAQFGGYNIKGNFSLPLLTAREY